ncbi:MAG: hypothetical protein JW925_07360 [Syntrophaceae bacterium]|nr:hypothetical protein [Syntrophaceae bacterium]
MRHSNTNGQQIHQQPRYVRAKRANSRSGYCVTRRTLRAYGSVRVMTMSWRVRSLPDRAPEFREGRGKSREAIPLRAGRLLSSAGTATGQTGRTHVMVKTSEPGQPPSMREKAKGTASTRYACSDALTKTVRRPAGDYQRETGTDKSLPADYGDLRRADGVTAGTIGNTGHPPACVQAGRAEAGADTLGGKDPCGAHRAGL